MRWLLFMLILLFGTRNLALAQSNWEAALAQSDWEARKRQEELRRERVAAEWCSQLPGIIANAYTMKGIVKPIWQSDVPAGASAKYKLDWNYWIRKAKELHFVCDDVIQRAKMVEAQGGLSEQSIDELRSLMDKYHLALNEFSEAMTDVRRDQLDALMAKQIEKAKDTSSDEPRANQARLEISKTPRVPEISEIPGLPKQSSRQGWGAMVQELRDMDDERQRGAATQSEYDLRKSQIIRQIESSPEALQQLGLGTEERRTVWESLNVHQKAVICRLPQGAAPQCLDHILTVYSEIYSELIALSPQDAETIFLALGPENRLSLIFLSPEERLRCLKQKIGEMAADETRRPSERQDREHPQDVDVQQVDVKHQRNVAEVRDIMEGMISRQQSRVDEYQREAEEARRIVRESQERRAILEQEYRELTERRTQGR